MSEQAPPPSPDPSSSPSLGSGSPYIGPPPDKEAINLGMLCHLLGIFTGFLGPLIIWLLKKDSSPFVDDQGKESLNFQIAALIVCLACIPLNFLFCIGSILILVVQITRIVFGIIASMKANEGIAYRYPVTFRLIK
jgi:uncharacterized Tic20 family protein